MTEIVQGANQWDAKMLQLADSHSPTEISIALGGIISPEKVASRVQVLLRQKNWLTAAQEDALITYKLKMMLLEFEGKHLDKDTGMMRFRILDKLGARLERRTSATEEDLDKLYGNQGRLMGKVVDNALSYMKGALREKVDAEHWDALVSEALMSAQAEIAKHEAVDA